MKVAAVRKADTGGRPSIEVIDQQVTWRQEHQPAVLEQASTSRALINVCTFVWCLDEPLPYPTTLCCCYVPGTPSHNMVL